MKITKDELIKKIGIMFIKNGFASTTIEKLSKEIGLSKATFMFHFKSKEDMYNSVVESMILLLQKPQMKYKIHLGTLRDFIDEYVDGVDKTMIYGRELGFTSSEYFSFIQEVARRKPELIELIIHNCEEEEIKLWANQIKAAKISGEVREDVDENYAAKLLRESYVGYSFFRALNEGLTKQQAKDFLADFYNIIKK